RSCASSSHTYASPASSIASRAPVSRSTIVATPTTFPPAFRVASTAWRMEPPVVEVSSRITTSRPATSGPSTCRRIPCPFDSLRTRKAASATPRLAAACGPAHTTRARPVPLPFPAHEEGIDRQSTARGGALPRAHDRVRTHRRSADGGALPDSHALFLKLVQQQVADDRRGLVLQGHSAHVDVVVRFLARGEGDLPVHEGMFLHELGEAAQRVSVHGFLQYRKLRDRLACYAYRYLERQLHPHPRRPGPRLARSHRHRRARHPRNQVPRRPVPPPVIRS